MDVVKEGTVVATRCFEASGSMNDALYDFEWTVAPSYEWQDWLDRAGRPIVVPSISLESARAVELAWNQSRGQDKKSGPVLCPAANDGSSVRRYRPMQRQHAALFREFGEVDYRSREEVLNFALRYGLLGVSSQTQSVNYRGQGGEPRLHYVAGEAFLDWSFEICLMREGIGLVGGGRSAKGSHRLEWLFNRNLQHVQGRVSFNQSGELRLVLPPLTLIAAMWLQLTLAATGE
jgi:hypothetical protein